MKKLSIYTFLSLLLSLSVLISCSTTYKLSEKSSSTYRINKNNTSSDAASEKLIAPYREQLGEVMNKEIAICNMSLIKTKPESTLGNFIADALYDEAIKLTDKKISFATQNYGGIRIGEIPKGPVTIGKVYELMPFDNTLVILSIKGDDLLQFFERITAYGGWPLSSNIKMSINDEGIVDLFINGEELQKDKLYHIALPDYIANGGDKCSFFEDKEKMDTGILIRDILIKTFQQKSEKEGGITAKIDGRITKK